MGWLIDNLDGYTRSGTQIANLMDLAERHLDAREIPGLDPIARRQGHEPFSLTPREAASARDALNTLADRLAKKRFNREARGWAEFARRIASAADIAARSGRPWRWS